jgi:ferrochelatase
MIGILLIQLGTPDAPTPKALRTYLRQFLSDRRVIEAPRLLWWFILNFKILWTRPAESAAKYQRIWDPKTGSPLLHYTRQQAELLQQALPHVPVRFGMQVGNPPVGDVVREMIGQGIDRLIVLPMYPQYSATTTASATDALFKILMEVRRVPTLRIVPPYFEHHAYLDAMTVIVREELSRLGWEPEHYLYSFHGLPQKYADKGDPYPAQVVRTTQALQQRLRFPDGRWSQTYQSRFGRSEWLKPYTDDALEQLAKRGTKRVFVVLPGFTVDCLETLDEIGHESTALFEAAGGDILHACRCLNDHPAWIAAMKQIVLDEGQGWINADSASG